MQPHPLVSTVTSLSKKLAPELFKRAYDLGLAVTRPDGTTKPIPLTLTPVIVTRDQLHLYVDLAAKLSSATTKMAHALIAHSEDPELILGALSPLERKLAEKTRGRLDTLATTRVDFFMADKPWALEVNATIPAMQAYSDIAARAYVETMGRYLGAKDAFIANAIAKNGSNTLALYRALYEGFVAQRGRPPERMALLCRRNDAQLTEQRYLAERFSEFGTEAEVIHPDELSGDDAVMARGKKIDLIYRHLFVRRLEETPNPYVEQLYFDAPSDKVVLLNGPASQVEVKATFAMLSQALSERGFARLARLTDAELDAISRGVPWTRPFRRAAGVGPDGAKYDDLVELVAENPNEFVLKRSWDYGGKAVFVGASQNEPSFAERVQAAFGAPLSWRELCLKALEDKRGGGFVVQKVVKAVPQEHLLCTTSDALPTELYVDFSAYASVGLPKQPNWGGVCRGSMSRIVNIQGGGGVIPLLTQETADSLFTAFKAHGYL